MACLKLHVCRGNNKLEETARHDCNIVDGAVETFTPPTLYEPCHEKTCLCHMRTTKMQISLYICAV